MKKLLLTLILGAIVTIASAQTQQTRHLNKRLQKVQVISDAYYYEIIEENNSGGGVKTRFLIADSSKVSIYTYSDLYGGNFKQGVLHGPYLSWYENGKKEYQADYTNGKLHGEYKRWYENGKLNYKMKYREGLKHDTLTAFYETGELRRKEVYDSGSFVTGKLYTKDGKELDFFPMEQMAEFEGGEKEMMKWLSMNVRYPGSAIRMGMEGIAVVSFVVEKDGSICEVETLNSVFPDIDHEAIRVVSSMPKWKPGKLEGEPVRVRYSIPLKFGFK